MWSHIPGTGNSLGLELQSLQSKNGSGLDGGRSPRSLEGKLLCCWEHSRPSFSLSLSFFPSMVYSRLYPHTLVKNLQDASSRKSLEASARPGCHSETQMTPKAGIQTSHPSLSCNSAVLPRAQGSVYQVSSQVLLRQPLGYWTAK